MTEEKAKEPEVSVETEEESEEEEYDYKGKLEWLGDQVTELKATLAEERAKRDQPPTSSTDSQTTGQSTPAERQRRVKQMGNPFARRKA